MTYRSYRGAMVGVALTSGVWACATATTGDTSQGGPTSNGVGGTAANSIGGATAAVVGSVGSVATGVQNTGVGGSTASSTTGVGPTSTTAPATTATTAAAATGVGGAAATAAATTAATSGGTDGCAVMPLAAAEAIAPDTQGWVACNSNAAGIQGAFFSYEDTGGSAVTTFTATPAQICMEGTVAQVEDEDYAGTFGVGMGLNLSQKLNDNTAYAWDAMTAGATGFSFQDTVFPAGAEVRLIFDSGTKSYCATITAGGSYLFSQTVEECWDGGAMSGTPTLSSIKAIKWQLVANATEAYDFDFCVTGLTVDT